MNKQDIHISLIEKYLDNNLDTDESQLFEHILENDEAFVRDLNDMELLISGIKKSASLTTIEEKLERFENSIKIMGDEEEDIKTLPRTTYFAFEHIKKYSWAIAASITIVLVSSITLFNINQPTSHQKLYDEYFSPFENYGTKRSLEKVERDVWKEALFLYDNGRYQEALDNFNHIIISDYQEVINNPRYSLYNIYKGNTLMQLNRHDDAIRLFTGMLEDDDGMFLQARWYLSMCYLHENNTENLVPLLEKIAEIKGSHYSLKAQEILDEIE